MAGKPGMRKEKPQADEAERQRIWNAMRVLIRFTSADLQATAEAGKDNVRKYLQALHAQDYLRLDAPKIAGVPGGHALWRLIKNTGPIAPRISADGLYDANVAEPKPRPEDKPLCRHAAGLLVQLRKCVDLLERMDRRKTVIVGEIDRAIADSRDMILKAEGRA